MSTISQVAIEFATVSTMPTMSPTVSSTAMPQPAKPATVESPDPRSHSSQSETAWLTPHGSSSPPAIRRRAFSTVWRRRASFAGQLARAAARCAPTCASFATADEARAAGFRACKRCRPTIASGATALGGTASSSPLDEIRRHIERNLDRHVRLEELGRVAGMSPFTVQRLFKREMGVSPLAVSASAARGGCARALKKGDTVTDAIYDAGFSSSRAAPMKETSWA